MTKSLFLLFTLFFIVYSIQIDVDSNSELVSKIQFTDFMNKYERIYSTQEEFQLRFGNFKESLKRIQEKNQKSAGKGANYGITKFSDLSPKEFKAKYLTANVPATQRLPGIGVMDSKVEAIPKTLDWRKKGAVTPVKDQGQCGSCWAFSITENVESIWILAGKAKASTLRLAPQQLVDCSDLDLGCGGGNTAIGYEYVLNNGGLMSETNYPYKAVDGTCAFNSSQVVAKISNWKYATWTYNEDEVQASLVKWGPLSVCVDAASWQDYVSGVMTWEECAYVNLLDHCVQLVGYEIDPVAGKYWIVRNSWNTNWGINGYIHLAMGGDTCGIAHQAASAFV